MDGWNSCTFSELNRVRISKYNREIDIGVASLNFIISFIDLTKCHVSVRTRRCL
jgi:hypothetical protein